MAGRRLLKPGLGGVAAIGLLAAGAMIVSPATTQAKKAHAKSTHSKNENSKSSVHIPGAKLEPLSFATLEGWKDDDQAAAFSSFLNSCRAILNSTPAMHRKRPLLGKLFKACQQAQLVKQPTTESARKFFEDNFQPVRIVPPTRSYGFYTGTDGFFTGYYEPQVEGSRLPSEEYKYPLYRVPAKVAGKKSTVFAGLDRKDIIEGALAGKGLEICWVKSPVDAFFAQIQGSTRVKLDTGDMLRLNYIASNGKPYTPVGRILIEDGIISAQEMTMDKIREYMETNPEKGAELRLKNRSYVFFRETALKIHEEPIGAQGVPLTTGRSIAVDPKIHVYGTPVWIDARLPIKGEAPVDAFRRLVIAQDTGSAIKGPARADIYFGYGGDAPSIAGRIKQFGGFVMLVPKGIVIDKPKVDEPAVATVPVPKSKPPKASAENEGAPKKDDSKPAPNTRPKT
jgi:membrane-bound lytic murein transglycosylase A